MNKTQEDPSKNYRHMLKRPIAVILSILVLALAFKVGTKYAASGGRSFSRLEESSQIKMGEGRRQQGERRPAISHEELFEKLLTVSPQDPVRTVELLGALVSMSDSGVRTMWQQLLTTAPRLDGAANMMAAYLWKRMYLMSPDTPMPDGWELDRFNIAREDQHEELHANIRRRLEAGELVTDHERQLFFADEISRDSLAAVNLWAALTPDSDSIRELSWFARAFMNEATRDKLLAAIMAWNAKQRQPAGEAFLLSILMEDWLATSPCEVEQWLSAPERARLRDELLGNLATQMAGDDPIKPWE